MAERNLRMTEIEENDGTWAILQVGSLSISIGTYTLHWWGTLNCPAMLFSSLGHNLQFSSCWKPAKDRHIYIHTPHKKKQKNPKKANSSNN